MEDFKMELLGKYKNGNYNVRIYDDGTKIRETNDDVFVPNFPECVDLKITNYCDMGCLYCHEDSNINGEHSNILNEGFINTIHPYTELAIGGGNPLSHPDLIEFLTKLKNKNIITNITVNQEHFLLEQYLIKELVDNDLVKGIGVSLIKVTDKLISTIKQYPNVVIHVINGIVKIQDLRKLYCNDLKLLILGYKQIRRGKSYHPFNFTNIVLGQEQVYDNIYKIINNFKVTSFDNLAIEQLELKEIFTDKQWQEFYMGDDGQFTMYVDLVKREFASSSTSDKRYGLLDNVDDMFKVVRSE